MLKRKRRGIAAIAAVVSLSLALTQAKEPNPRSDRYVLDYPTAEQFSPPVASYFDDVSQSVQKIGKQTVRHQLNGGYGLPVVIKVEGKHLVHLGADVAWYRTGQPVYTIAAGVVRMSEGPLAAAAVENRPKEVEAKRAESGKKAADAAPRPSMEWGNVIVIEHRLPDGSYVTSVYGHLSANRLVKVGEIVQAGQVIGSIGRPGVENGGYKPHLHLGLREGRMREKGSRLLTMAVNGRSTPITIVELNENEVELSADAPLPTPIHVQSGGQVFAITARDGKLWIPAAALNSMRRPDFPITGYALSTEGWRDPTEFLLAMLNQFPRAPVGDPALAGAATSASAEQPDSPELQKARAKVAAVERLKKARRPKLYNPKALGESQVKLALARAKKGEKRVLLMYGGNWCGPCYELHDVLTQHNELRAVLRCNYELVMIDVRSEANQKLAADYQAELNQHGLPYITVLDAEGQVLANQGANAFEVDSNYDPAKLLALLQEHAPQKPAVP